MSFIRRQKVPETDSNNIEGSLSIQSKKPQSNELQSKKRVAIIGSGVSGLTCAHYLAKQYQVTIFEANDYIGGHVNTIDVTLQDGKKNKASKVESSAIDTGFIVFNERTYPNFFRLLYDLQVPFQATDMSFSVKNTARSFEYNGHTVNTLLSQRKNVLSPKFWRFINDILQFNKHIKQLRQDYDKARDDKARDDKARDETSNVEDNGQRVKNLTAQTLGGYLASKRYGALFTDNYLLPMVSAIWSTSLEEVQDFPLVFFAQFFDNHGLLDVVNRPQWFTIKGGSKQYVNKLVRRFVKAGGTIKVNSPVKAVTRKNDNVIVVVNKASVTDKVTDSAATDTFEFDEVIFACHADTALKLLHDASTDETEVLSHFRFTSNTATLHTDSSVLPKKTLAWASWNYLIDHDSDNQKQGKHKKQPQPLKPVLTYHMNILQRLTKQHNYLVTLNHQVDDSQVIKRIDYSHPVFNNDMIAAQAQWSRISGGGLHTHFCGAYWFNGFHEDGVRSGLRVCQALAADIEIKDEVDSAHLPDADSAHTPFVYKDLPVKADKQIRKLKKRNVMMATTNQELVDYITTLQTDTASSTDKVKRGFFGRRL